MKKTNRILKVAIMIFMVLSVSLITDRTYSFWVSTILSPEAQTSNAEILVGSWSYNGVEEWEPNAGYTIGDQFIYNGIIWEIRGGGNYNNPPGTNGNLRPYGPYQEVTDEYRSYNTYVNGDIVIYNGAQFQAIYGGMSGKTPGTVVGWQELTNEWRFYNVYQGGDTVIYEGNTYQARWYTQGNEPDTANVWELQN